MVNASRESVPLALIAEIAAGDFRNEIRARAACWFGEVEATAAVKTMYDCISSGIRTGELCPRNRKDVRDHDKTQFHVTGSHGFGNRFRHWFHSFCLKRLSNAHAREKTVQIDRASAFLEVGNRFGVKVVSF